MTISSDPSALFFLGRRIERLIFVGILLIVLCFIETYIVTANKQLAEDRSTGAIVALLNRLLLEEQRLTILFQTKPEPPVPRTSRSPESIEKQNLYLETRKKLGLPPPSLPKAAKPRLKPPTYQETLNTIVSEVVKSSNAKTEELNNYIDIKKSPSDLIKILQQQKETIENKPTTVWGIQTPRLLQVQYAGQDYKIPLGFLSGILAVALAPLIIGWLGAIYMTRQRELMLITELEDYKLAFPHILNFLPVTFDKLEKRFQGAHKPRLRTITRTINWIGQSTLRSCVILLFITPMIFSFFYSLYQLWEAQGDIAPTLLKIGAFLAIVMFIQALALLLQEWLILHKKDFYE